MAGNACKNNNKYNKKRKDIAFVWIGPDEGKAEEVLKLINEIRKSRVFDKGENSTKLIR